MSTFKSSPSGSTLLIIPSPNFLWYIFTPALYLDKSTFVPVAFLVRLFRKLSAVLNINPLLFELLLAAATDGSCLSILYVFIFPLSLLPYVQLYFESPNTLLLSCFSPNALSYPSNKSLGISLKNLDTWLQLVDPNIVRCLLHVKNKYSFALVIPT